MRRSFLRRLDDALQAFRFGHTRADARRNDRYSWLARVTRRHARAEFEGNCPTPPDAFAHCRHGQTVMVLQTTAVTRYSAWLVQRLRYLRSVGYIVDIDGDAYWCDPPIGRATREHTVAEMAGRWRP